MSEKKKRRVNPIPVKERMLWTRLEMADHLNISVTEFDRRRCEYPPYSQKEGRHPRWLNPLWPRDSKLADDGVRQIGDKSQTRKVRVWDPK